MLSAVIGFLLIARLSKQHNAGLFGAILNLRGREQMSKNYPETIPAEFSADALACRLSELLRRVEVDVLVTHPYEGGHPDHDTAALVAHLAIHTLCRESAPLLVEMTSYHANDRQCVSGMFLNPDTDQELQLHLSEAERTRKADMFAAYASQRRVLGGFPIDHERFRAAPEYDFTGAPHPGKLWYECMAWPMTGRQWRALAMEKIAGVQELSCP